MINAKTIIKMELVLLLILIPLVYSETTFFDNPDDFFIMGDIPATEVPSVGGGSGVYKPLCNPLWICDKWSNCYNGLRNRICNDIKNCNSEEKPPLLLSCSQPLPSDRINGCVSFSELNKLIFGWKINVFRFDILNEAIYKWKRNIGC